MEAEVNRQTLTYFPYSSSFEPLLIRKSDSECFRDKWSLGAILLEMLIGSDLMLTLDHSEELRDLLELVGKYLDEMTVMFLEALFCFGDYLWFGQYVN